MKRRKAALVTMIAEEELTLGESKCFFSTNIYFEISLLDDDHKR